MDNDKYIWGEPINYKGIDFYPLHLNEHKYYQLMIKLLTYPKNSIADINVLHMSYLKFILCCIQFKNEFNQIENAAKLLCDLLSCVTKSDVNTTDNLGYKPLNSLSKDKNILTIDNIADILILIKGVLFNQNDFDNIRQIILEQNGWSLDYINQYDPSLEEKLAYFQKDVEVLDFKEEVFSFSAYMRKTVEEIKNYTFLQFKETIERIQLLKNEGELKPLEVSGQISFKDGSHIKSWWSHIPQKGRYDSILVAKDKFVKENDFFKVAGNLDDQQLMK